MPAIECEDCGRLTTIVHLTKHNVKCATHGERSYGPYTREEPHPILLKIALTNLGYYYDPTYAE